MVRHDDGLSPSHRPGTGPQRSAAARVAQPSGVALGRKILNWIHVSMRSSAKTPPSWRSAWSFSSAISASSRDEGTCARPHCFTGTRFGIIRSVDAAVLLTEARRRSGLSRRSLAQRGGTSASTLSAYESGRSVPSVSTLERLLGAAGFEAETTLRPLPPSDEGELRAKIEALFAFVDALPRRRRGPLKYPVFGGPATAPG